jgi:hypothetical protein
MTASNPKISLTKKELKMLVSWCRCFIAPTDNKQDIKMEHEYIRLSNKLREYYK